MDPYDKAEHVAEGGEEVRNGEGGKVGNREGGENKLSKNQMKKLAKKEKWEETKQAKRAVKRIKEKEKRKMEKEKEKEKMGRQEKEAQQTEMKTIRDPLSEPVLRRKEDYVLKMRESVVVVIDLQFYDLMVEKEQRSLIKQLAYCHSVNRRSDKCFNLVFTSVTHPRRALISQQYNADKWGIHITEQYLLQQFLPPRIVYLTGDAEEELEDFQEDCVYVIGGIVDHNRLKNITIDYAKKEGIRAVRLPMGQVRLKASVHLAVNHVFQWMLKKYNGSTWEEAVRSVIPLRKMIH